MADGKIVQCIGAVVDVEFPRNAMPKVFDALKMAGSDLTLEVQQQLGDGIVVLTTGNPWLASNIGGQWVFWRTGHVDLRFMLTEGQRVFPVLAIGWVVILAVAIFLGAVGFVVTRRTQAVTTSVL